MLEKRDLDILKQMMASIIDERLAQSEVSILEKVDERLAQSEVSILEKVDERLAQSENLILAEVERTRSILENKIQKVQTNMDELNQYYKITKLENDNTALLLRLIDQLSKRVAELEKKIA